MVTFSILPAISSSLKRKSPSSTGAFFRFLGAICLLPLKIIFASTNLEVVFHNAEVCTAPFAVITTDAHFFVFACNHELLLVHGCRCCVIQNIANAYPQDGGFITNTEAEWYSPLLTFEQPYSRFRIIVGDVNYRNHAAQDNNLFTDFGLSELQLYAPFDTGIEGMASDGSVNGSNNTLYDLYGRRLSDTRVLPAGIYVRKGQKIIIR